MRAVVRGSRIRIMTAANRLGLYSAFRACNAIFFKSSLHPRLTVETIFCNCGTICESTDGVIGVRGVIGPCAEYKLDPMTAEDGVEGSIAVPEMDLGWALSDEGWTGVAPELTCFGAGDGAEKFEAALSWCAGCIGDGCTSWRVRKAKCCASGSNSF